MESLIAAMAYRFYQCLEQQYRALSARLPLLSVTSIKDPKCSLQGA
ncbi:predicted protein [Botrytis cinerea T4]|uniref:Uncharacterized protein n=1 Tax=Botryotinia fuckeliana (strain T4) TaxID=999810 RepID=G2XUG3_BOTF4|nr:predicted protein [Botrytis cinerea T4]